jgi:DNA repair photolyase
MEPRAVAPPTSRGSQKLAEAAIPVGVMTAPMIPPSTTATTEAILEAAAARGATMAGYTVLPLP